MSDLLNMRVGWHWKCHPGFAVIGVVSRLTVGRLSLVWRHGTVGDE